MTLGQTFGSGDDPVAEAPAVAMSGGVGKADEAAMTIPPALADPAILAKAKFRVEETTEAMYKIADDVKMPHSSFRAFAKRMSWLRPPGAPGPIASSRATWISRRPANGGFADAGAVAARLFRAVDRQVMMIENRAKKTDAALEERDARMLAALAKTLQTLMALDRNDGAGKKTAEPVDRDALDADLVRRITRWARGGEKPV